MIARLARIRWLPGAKGAGRRRRSARVTWPPQVPVRYRQLAHEAWSLVVDLVDRPHGPDEWLARIQFLVDEAPHHLIADHVHFELYEGKRCVAHGYVESPADDAPRPVPDDSIRGPRPLVCRCNDRS